MQPEQQPKQTRGEPGGPEIEPAAEEQAAPPMQPSFGPAICWRCGLKLTEPRDVCPLCEARLTRQEPQQVDSKPAPLGSPLITLLKFFSVLLATSMIFGWVVHFGLRGEDMLEDETDPRWPILVAVEVVDAGLVLFALFMIGRPPPLGPCSIRRRVIAWTAAGPVLAVTLGLNVGYHWALRHLLPMLPSGDGHDVSAWNLLLICVQPAIVEELFFRYLALGTLRRVLGMHGAVWVSAVMFGMAHIFVLPSIPLLTLVGVVLGYMRVWSGGMTLPISLHFLHNLAIIALAAWLQ
jgi:uncharacterized protein